MTCGRRRPPSAPPRTTTWRTLPPRIPSARCFWCGTERSSSPTTDHSIGLNAPSDTERRAVIGITGSYRPETVKRLTIGLTTLDAALRQRYGTGLRDTLVMLGGPLRDRPAERRPAPKLS